MWIEILLFCAMMAFTGAGVLAYFFESLSAPGIFFIMAAIAAVYFFKLDFRAVIDAAYWVALLSVPYVIAALAWGVAKWYLMIKARFVDVKSKLDNGRKLTEEEIGRELGINEGAVKVAVHRLRQRFRDLLREEVSHTVGSPDEVDAELRHLLGVFGGRT